MSAQDVCGGAQLSVFSALLALFCADSGEKKNTSHLAFNVNVNIIYLWGNAELENWGKMYIVYTVVMLFFYLHFICIYIYLKY